MTDSQYRNKRIRGKQSNFNNFSQTPSILKLALKLFYVILITHRNLNSLYKGKIGYGKQ